MLETLDLTKKLADKKEYEEALKKYQLRLLECWQRIRKKGVPVLLVFEGWDAAGKGGAIKRVTDPLDPRGYQVSQVGPPSPDELAHHYLRRFWIRLPRRGQIVLFDRSWYGRVLVERVEKFATKEEWKRAYDEINTFERMLIDGGTVLMKFWLHISKDEQLRRLKEREQNPYKRWKITEDDWRNRKKWGKYEAAVEGMLERTNTDYAPWTLVEGNYKWYARIKVIRTITETLGERLTMKWMDET
ncbi:MAG: UDP-galactose-lipid carrier transferase [Candidatus Latescibacteria bacterium]|nr:UDP-galactose-lipid carrier transferase [Candidatus Latescibacterota bacterium]